MTTPVRVAAATSANGTLTASITGFTATLGQLIGNDYVILTVYYANSNASPAPTVSMSGVPGLTLIGSQIAFGSNKYMAVYAGFFTAQTGTGNYNVTVSNPSIADVVAVTLTAWRYVDTTTPLDGVTLIGTGPTASGTSHTLTGVTTGTDGAKVVMCYTANNDNGSGNSVVTALSSGWAEDSTYGTSSGSDCSVGVASKTVATAGASGSLTITTGASVNMAGYALSLRPSSNSTADKFVGRVDAAQVNAASGTFSRTAVDPSTATKLGPQFPAGPNDTAIVIVYTSDASTALISDPPGSPWTALYTGNPAGKAYQVYAARYLDISTWPTFSWSVNAPIDRCFVYSLILRDINLYSPLNVAAFATGSSNTPTFPSVTPNKNNCILLKLWFQDFAYTVSTAAPPSSGTIIVAPIAADSTIDSTGAAKAIGVILEVLSGGSGSPTGTSTVRVIASNAWATITIALSPADPVQSISSPVDVGSLVVTSNVGKDAPATYMTTEVDVGAAQVSTTLGATHGRRPLRRATVWISDLAGRRIAALLSSQEFS